MKMKKIFLVAVMAVLAMTVSAQVEQGSRMGVRANVGMSKVTGGDAKMALSYGVAWVAEYNFSPKLFLQSGLGLERLGWKADDIDGTVNSLYVQLPIHVGYRFNLGEVSNLFVQAGPTLGYGIAGSDITDGSKTINYFDSAKRFDLSAGGRVGVEMGKYQLSLGANYGVLEVFDGGGHNLNINLGFTYLF